MLVYRRDARRCQPGPHDSGHKTKLLQIVGISVDPVRDLLVVSTYSRLPGGVDRSAHLQAHGYRQHRAAACHCRSETGIARLRQIGLDPATGRIFVAAINDEYLPPYNIDKPREGLPPTSSSLRRGIPAARGSSASGTMKATTAMCRRIR